MEYNDYWYWDKEIPHEICQKIINLGKGNWNPANKTEPEQKDGECKHEVIRVNDQWVYDLIWNYMLAANEIAGWKYDIVAAESCQVARYPKDGFYAWHVDGMGSHNCIHYVPENKSLHGTTRKLSMSVFLNSDFEGGNFEIGGEHIKTPRCEEGSIIVFPSYTPHRVTPVTKGIRYSVVTWFVGPPFR